LKLKGLVFKVQGLGFGFRILGLGLFGFDTRVDLLAIYDMQFFRFLTATMWYELFCHTSAPRWLRSTPWGRAWSSAQGGAPPPATAPAAASSSCRASL
jgi:hypothetical protein